MFFIVIILFSFIVSFFVFSSFSLGTARVKTGRSPRRTIRGCDEGNGKRLVVSNLRGGERGSEAVELCLTAGEAEPSLWCSPAV